MHLVTGLMVLLELVLLGGQLVSWLYFPKERRNLLYAWLLVLMLLYNVCGGFFPDPDIGWIDIKLQTMLAWGSGFAVAAYIPYYFYAAFGLKRLKFFAFKGMLLFLALPYFVFFVVEYHLLEDIAFSIRWGLLAPAVYGVAFFWFAYQSIRERYRSHMEEERLEMYLSYIAVLPWICMVPFGYFGVGQLTEVLTTNCGFLVITAILFARSIREKREERQDLLALKDMQGSFPTEALFEENLLKYGFSSREIDVVRLMRQGLSMQDIADKLFIAPATVSKHAQNIYYKAEVKGRLELMRRLEISE